MTPKDVEHLQMKLVQSLEKIPGQIIGCTHITGQGVLAPELMSAFAAVLRRDNPHMERSAVLIPVGQDMLAMQLERILRDASSSNRRLFREPAALEAWLADVLSGAERLRLRAFLTTRV